MSLLESEVIENLLHSSSISKGIERTMEQMINELELDSIYIIHYEEGVISPEISFEWEGQDAERNIDFQSYIDSIEEWYHFDEEDLYVARATMVLPVDEKRMYEKYGYKAVVEYQMTKHGKVLGYIILGWNHIKELPDEELNDIHVLLKLMNELLIKQFYKEVIGESDYQLFKLASSITKTLLYLVDDEYRIQFINNYAKELYPNIKNGDFCYKSLCGQDSPCKECPYFQLEDNEVFEISSYFPYLDDSFQISATRIKISQDNRKGLVLAMKKQIEASESSDRRAMGRKLIFALKMLYKDIIAVEIRRDKFYDMMLPEKDNKFSYSMDFVLKWLSKVHLEDKQRFLECFDINFLQNAYLAGVESKEIEFKYRTHEGSYHCMNGKILFEQNTNKDVTVFILFQDVEQIRSTQLEEFRQLRDSLMAARSSAELKGEVLANISHEIRTPMSGIISMSSVAKQIYKQEDKLLECLENIDEYADHMMEVMDSLLETVKVNNDNIEIANQPFGLEHLLNRIDISIRETIEKKNVHFHIRSQCQQMQVLGDEIRLYQAMITLINNAISYTPISGDITLTAKQVAIDGKKVFIRFFIEDTGNGLSDKMKESIFGFSHSGTEGFIDEEHFNLSLASKIINMMGGSIGINVDAKGTHLYFTLPFELQEEAKIKQSKRKSLPVAGNYNGKRILLVEDSEMGQDALRAVLEVVGFEVDTVENGRKAVINFISQPAFSYDAILMDVHMPVMDGREATKCIRISGKEDGESIPIIGLMANTFEEDVKESLQAGMQAHLAKPVDVDKLYTVLKKLIPDGEEL